MKANIFLIRCLSNMHVGNGEVNYSLVDNEVEKDVVLEGTPVINASGVKGALREHFEQKWGKDDERIIRIFGGEKRQGQYKFLQATTLFRPLRVSDGKESFIEATTPELLNHFTGTACALGAKVPTFSTEIGICGQNVLEVEGKREKAINADSQIGELLKKAFSSEASLAYYVTHSLEEYPLPVLARNVLDDGGISKNLWYEEVVPHETILWTAILTPEEMDVEFLSALKNDVLQFGGSASVGYGLTKMVDY